MKHIIHNFKYLIKEMIDKKITCDISNDIKYIGIDINTYKPIILFKKQIIPTLNMSTLNSYYHYKNPNKLYKIINYANINSIDKIIYSN